MIPNSLLKIRRKPCVVGIIAHFEDVNVIHTFSLTDICPTSPTPLRYVRATLGALFANLEKSKK